MFHAGNTETGQWAPQAARLILTSQLKLLQRALAPWPRRAAPLLEVNCGKGKFLPFLWQWGFDTVATEFDAANRAVAFVNGGAGQEIRAASDADLPFDDDFFDWVILHLDNSAKNPDASIKEAMRVGRRGLMFTFWNRTSLPVVCWRLTHARPVPVAAHSWHQMWKRARNLRIGRVSGMTTLCAPVFAWHDGSWLNAFNAWSPAMPLGAWAVLRLDIEPGGTVTPLRMRLEKAIARAEPAMEYTNKNLSNKIGR